MAVAGMSFYAASGDSGSSDCDRLRHQRRPRSTTRPSQPYATGVGGTNLDPASSAHNETVWGGHGPRPAAAAAASRRRSPCPAGRRARRDPRPAVSSKTKCGGKTHYCREVPDVVVRRRPQHRATSSTARRPAAIPGWNVFGGTSAAAPLMAAFTADANQFSLANGGERMGFANPFLYHEFGADPVRCSTTSRSGNEQHPRRHDVHGRSRLRPGDRPRLGRTSTRWRPISRATPARRSRSTAPAITAGASRNPISAGHPTILGGTLKDHHTHTVPRPCRRSWIEGFIVKSGHTGFFRLHTGMQGRLGHEADAPS